MDSKSAAVPNLVIIVFPFFPFCKQTRFFLRGRKTKREKKGTRVTKDVTYCYMSVNENLKGKAIMVLYWNANEKINILTCHMSPSAQVKEKREAENKGKGISFEGKGGTDHVSI